MRWGKPVATLIQKVTHLENTSVNKNSLFEFFSPEACPANTKQGWPEKGEQEQCIYRQRH